MTSATSTETTVPARSAKPWYRQLWAQVLLGMAAGIVLGYLDLDPALGERMAPLGDAFIKAIRMLIAPIIFCTVVHGIARMADMARVGRVAIKALIYFEVLTTLALVIGLVAANLWRPGAGMNVDLSRIDTSAVSAYVAQTQKQDTST
jgi:aerobic C4-dicarboxylate transport protein